MKEIKRFELTSQHFEGYVVYSYDTETQRLVSVDATGLQASTEMFNWIWSHIPYQIDKLKYLTGKTGKIVEVIEDLTFDMFWNKYNDKARSSKVKTQRYWDRMSKKEQRNAYDYIQRYFNSIPQGVCKKYATTYLNDQLWNN